MTTGENSNLEIWNKYGKTDEKYTKQVNQRGGFTAIDAYYQIQQATELWGPMGGRWGYKCEFDFGAVDNHVVAFFSLWYPKGKPDDDTANYIHLGNMIPLQGKYGVDSDALKKLQTDSLTKCLSYLGFSHDVFMGQFHPGDNRYTDNQQSDKIEPNYVKPGSDRKPDEPKSEENNATDKQRKTIYAIGCAVWGSDNVKAKLKENNIDTWHISLEKATETINWLRSLEEKASDY